MQEAKRYEGWNVMHTVPYEVLNVANPTSARQAFTPVYQCITSSRVAHWMGIFMLDLRVNRYKIGTTQSNSSDSILGVYDAQCIDVDGADSDHSRLVV